MKTVKAKNRLNNNNNNSKKQAAITINPDFSLAVEFRSSLHWCPALILIMSFGSLFHFLAAKYRQDLRPYLLVLTLGNERI